MKKIFLYFSSLFFFGLFLLNTEYIYSATQYYTQGDNVDVTWTTTDVLPNSCVYYSSSSLYPGWRTGPANDNGPYPFNPLALSQVGTYDLGVRCTGSNVGADPLFSFTTLVISCTSNKTWNGSTCALPSGTLSASSCQIAVGQSSCSTDLVWSTSLPIGTSQVKNVSGTILYTANSSLGSTATVSGTSQTYHLFNNGNEIATAEAFTSCVSGSSWNGSICVLPTGFISSSAPYCEIPAGSSSCNVNLTWGTSYPVGTSIVRSGATTLFTANSGAGQSTNVNGPSQTYNLVNNGNTLDSVTVTTTCAPNSGWFAGKCNSFPNPPTIYGAIYPRLSTPSDYDFIGSDPDSDAVRYGIDWGSGVGLDGPLDGVVDEWIPVAYSSYLTQTTPHSWSTIQTDRVFKALTQDIYGQNSTWANYTISTQIDGVCGSSNGRAFSSTPTTNLCYSGDVSPISSLGTSWTWTCNGLNTGLNSPQCRAVTDSVPVVSATIAPETCIKSGWTLNSLSYTSTNASYCEVSTLGKKMEYLDDPDNNSNTNPSDYYWPTENTWYRPGPYFANQSWTFKCYNASNVAGNSVVKSLTTCANPPAPLPTVNINPSDTQTAIVGQTIRFLSNAGSSNNALTHHYFDIKYPGDTNFTLNVGNASVLTGVGTHDSVYDFKPVRAGRYFIRAAAKDSVNNIWVYTEEVEVIINDPVNPPPTVTITPSTNQVMYKGSRIALSSLALDTSNDIVQHRIDYLSPGKANIPSNWTLDASRAGIIPATGNHTLNYNFVPSVVGDYLVRATAKDRVNTEVYSKVIKLTVSLDPNSFDPQAPTVNLRPNASPVSIRVNDVITFVSDAASNDSILEQHHIDYQKDGVWYFNQGNSVSNLVNAASNQVTYIFNPSATGTYYIQAAAKDNFHTDWVTSDFVIVYVTDVVSTATCNTTQVKKYTNAQFSNMGLGSLCKSTVFALPSNPDSPLNQSVRTNYESSFNYFGGTKRWVWSCSDGVIGLDSSCEAEKVDPLVDVTAE